MESPKTHSSIGIDLGISDSAILSDGTKHDNNRFKKSMDDKFAREQRKLSRRMENAKKNGGSLSEAKNYQKQKKVVGRLHEKVTNQRNDFLNKRSTDIIKNQPVLF